ncbi:MAG TPA: hypothetical protein VMI73_20155 [Trebonia sp.]|nr:hypothetical protein [Trebonia sp.]
MAQEREQVAVAGEPGAEGGAEAGECGSVAQQQECGTERARADDQPVRCSSVSGCPGTGGWPWLAKLTASGGSRQSRPSVCAAWFIACVLGAAE